jgi:ATPase subunit of ABC transporter with duplicated ATPase domains
MSIVLSALSFSWPDDTPVFRNLSWTVGNGRTGLVAPNGAGKSTLLRLVAGELSPTAGSVAVDGHLGHLPQTLPLTADLTVADVLGVAPTLAALRALEGGDAGEAVFTAIGDDWNVEERARTQLERLGMGAVDLACRLDTLSGGQVVTLGLATQLLRSPDVLLLDEPTNNLDLDARRRLYGVVDDWRGTLLVVSHDRALLDRMDRIAELHADEVSTFGGGFTAYDEAVRAGRDAAERAARVAEQELRRERRQRQEARERAARRAGNASRNLADAGLPRALADEMRRGAQESAGRSDETHAARVAGARARLDAASAALRDDDVLVLDLPQTSVPAGRTLFEGHGLRVAFGGRRVIALDGVDLVVRGPERIALTGPNGSGKSTLLHLVRGDLAPTAGRVRRADGRVAYLSQRLDLLDPARSVAQSLALAAPALPEADRMNLLARFLFRGPDAYRPVGTLSGGELLRATLACVLHGEPAPQLLLLDEPTNNLDLVSQRQLESALFAFRGALVVVSHDERFLEAVGVTRRLRLAAGRLVDEGAPASR